MPNDFLQELEEREESRELRQLAIIYKYLHHQPVDLEEKLEQLSNSAEMNVGGNDMLWRMYIELCGIIKLLLTLQKEQ